MTANAGFVDTDAALAVLAKVLGWVIGAIVVVVLFLVLMTLGVERPWNHPTFDPQPRTVPGAQTITCAEQTARGDAAMWFLLRSSAGKNYRLEGCP